MDRCLLFACAGTGAKPKNVRMPFINPPLSSGEPMADEKRLLPEGIGEGGMKEAKVAGRLGI
jgi:hypothetical protein